jgi:hypothetical protein
VTKSLSVNNNNVTVDDQCASQFQQGIMAGGGFLEAHEQLSEPIQP